MSGRVWRRRDPEPLDGPTLMPAPDLPGGPWRRDPADGKWVCGCGEGTCAREPARWPWADLVAVDEPMTEVEP